MGLAFAYRRAVNNPHALHAVATPAILQRLELFFFTRTSGDDEFPVLRCGTLCAAQNSYVSRLPSRQCFAFSEPDG